MSDPREQRARWMIQVVYQSGDVAYLRHGSRVGAGPIVRFHSRKDADVNLDFILQGLDGATANVVRYDKSAE